MYNINNYFLIISMTLITIRFFNSKLKIILNKAKIREFNKKYVKKSIVVKIKLDSFHNNKN